jgi:phage terminase large subunit-like protein
MHSSQTLPSDSARLRLLLSALATERTKRQAEFARYDWSKHARPNQVIPETDWRFWLILAGRGFGKTRTGAETVRRWVKKYPLVNLIGATASDARDIMIEGESGILAITPKSERPAYVGSKSRLEWPNGARSLIFTADEPERLRGKQHMKLWCDELASWRYSDAWDQANFGLRLGDNPQAVITTTPKPIKLIRELQRNPACHITRGSTYENRANLADAFFSEIIAKYEGTRLGRQELLAEVLEDVEGALWTRKLIDDTRRPKHPIPDMARIVVAIDPAVTSGEDADETGMVVAGRGVDGRGYVLADLTCRLSPDAWAKRAVNAYHEFRADRIVAEVNNGGDLVERVIRTVDRNCSYRAVHASRGKRVRAEPIAALYEQARVSHCGAFDALEDQMCMYVPDQYDGSPDHVDALVWALTDLMLEGKQFSFRIV